MGDFWVMIIVITFVVLVYMLGKGKRQEHEQFGASWLYFEDGNFFEHHMSEYEQQARAVCNRLENIIAEYMKRPLKLDITEVGKFCLAFIGVKASLGDKRDKVVKNLISYFSEVQNFFYRFGYPLCTEHFKREWLLDECERMFGSYRSHVEVLGEIRRKIYIRDKDRYSKEVSYASDTDVETYKQSIQQPQRYIIGLGPSFDDRDELYYIGREERIRQIRCEGQPARRFQRLRDEALKTYLKCLRDVLTCTCLPLIRNNSKIINKQLVAKHYYEAEKAKIVPKQTAFNPYLSAPYLLDKLKKGVKINLSYGLVFETVKYSGRDYIEIHGLEGKYRNGVLDCGGKCVNIGCQEHILVATDNVLAIDYLLVFHKVLNIYDAPVCALDYEGHAIPATHPEPPEPSPPPHHPTPPDKPAELTATALALIGRPTLHENKYLTPAMTKSRHEAERPFLSSLAEKFPDKSERKYLSQHFMLWKELVLFLAFSRVLKSDKSLHTQIVAKLKGCLNEGLSVDVLKKRNEIFRAMSELFTETIKSTGKLSGALERSFWETLPDGMKERVFSGGLYAVYRYVHDGLKVEHDRFADKH